MPKHEYSVKTEGFLCFVEQHQLTYRDAEAQAGLKRPHETRAKGLAVS